MGNNELTLFEQRVLDFIRTHPECDEDEVWRGLMDARDSEINRAIVSLISRNYIVGSAEQPLTYSVAGGKGF